METLVNDLRSAIRVSLRSKAVATLAVLAFGPTIGVTAATCSTLSTVRQAPLSYPTLQKRNRLDDPGPGRHACPALSTPVSDWKAQDQMFSRTGAALDGSFVKPLTHEQLIGSATPASVIDGSRRQRRRARWDNPRQSRRFQRGGRADARLAAARRRARADVRDELRHVRALERRADRRVRARRAARVRSWRAARRRFDGSATQN